MRSWPAHTSTANTALLCSTELSTCVPECQPQFAFSAANSETSSCHTAPLRCSRPLSILNKEAADLQKAGDPLRAVAAYCKLFCKVKERNVIHAELHTCHSNRASAYLQVTFN